MKHFGDITKMNGAEVPIVDIITGGSPCQDLSIAGKRSGLKHSDKGDDETTRSGLFMEQIRIVKEMRNECARQLRVRGANVDIRLLKPRFMVWENVPGSLSSNNGEDFRCVLEETAKVVEECADIPRPKKWSNAGCIMGNGWSIAWRIHNSQYWGVPQRRRRLCLVADFNGGTAPNILFELLGEADEGSADKTIGCIGAESRCEVHNECEVLSRDHQTCGEQGQGASKASVGNIEEASEFVGISVGNGQTNQSYGDKVGALNCMHDQQAVLTYGIDRASFNQGKNAKFDFSVDEELSPTVVSRGPGGGIGKKQ